MIRYLTGPEIRDPGTDLSWRISLVFAVLLYIKNKYGRGKHQTLFAEATITSQHIRYDTVVQLFEFLLYFNELISFRFFVKYHTDYLLLRSN